MESLDSILADLQGKYTDPKPTNNEQEDKTAADPASDSSSLDSLLNDLRNSSSTNKSGCSAQIKPEFVTHNPLPVVDRTIDRAIDRAIDRDLQQISDRQKAKDEQAIAKKATEWLQKLDPLAGEGLWFEEFAKNYPSRLEAAIALIHH